MSSDEGDDLEDLLGRVSKKLGWQNDTENVETTFRKVNKTVGIIIFIMINNGLG